MQNDKIISRRAMLAGVCAFPLLMSMARSGHSKALPLISVTKDPSCGCCDGWAAHLKTAGFPLRVVESSDMDGLKQRLGVPAELASCHTAEVGGYVVEGHVPAVAIRRLLTERPDAKGVAVPGMPAGSPGMDFPGTAPQPYEAFLFGPAVRAFGRFLGPLEI